MKRLLYGLLLIFILFCMIGFFDVGGTTLLAFLVPFVLLALCLAFYIPGIKPAILRNYLWLTIVGVVLFSAGVTYGILGIWGLYEIDDRIYLGTVMLAWAGFLLGLIESFVHIRKANRQEGKLGNPE